MIYFATRESQNLIFSLLISFKKKMLKHVVIIAIKIIIIDEESDFEQYVKMTDFDKLWIKDRNDTIGRLYV